MMLNSLMDPNDVEKVTISKHVVLQSALCSKPQDDSFLKGLQQQQISINRAKTELSSLLLLVIRPLGDAGKVSSVLGQQM